MCSTRRRRLSYNCQNRVGGLNMCLNEGLKKTVEDNNQMDDLVLHISYKDFLKDLSEKEYKDKEKYFYKD